MWDSFSILFALTMYNMPYYVLAHRVEGSYIFCAPNMVAFEEPTDPGPRWLTCKGNKCLLTSKWLQGDWIQLSTLDVWTQECVVFPSLLWASLKESQAEGIMCWKGTGGHLDYRIKWLEDLASWSLLGFKSHLNSISKQPFGICPSCRWLISSSFQICLWFNPAPPFIPRSQESVASQ